MIFVISISSHTTYLCDRFPNCINNPTQYAD